MQIDLIVDAKAAHGEGPVWHSERGVLYWVDIIGCKLHIFNPRTGADSALWTDQSVCCLAPWETGGVVAGMHDGFALIDTESGVVSPICDPEPDLPSNRFNDGKCDPAGRFWAGTCSEGCDIPGAGSLYCLDSELQVEKKLEGMTIPNGLAWSPDYKTFYYIDTPTFEIWAFDYDLASGRIGNRRTAVTVSKEIGFPDGMTIDVEGMLWVAHWGGACVCRWNPADGKLLRKIELPVENVSCCVFGGENLEDLYVTSSRLGLDVKAIAAQPQAGGLFRCTPGVRGTPTHLFRYSGD